MVKIIVIGCVDERLSEIVRNFLNSHGLQGQYLLANVPAPSLNYQVQELTLTKVADKKGASEVWLIDHQNCGGYALADESDSLQNHKKHLAEATEVLIKHYGFESVRTFLAEQSGDENWEIKEI